MYEGGVGRFLWDVILWERRRWKKEGREGGRGRERGREREGGRERVGEREREGAKEHFTHTHTHHSGMMDLGLHNITK